MGEEAWKQYQIERKRGNSKDYRIKRKADICKAVSKCRKQRKLDLIDYKGGKCERCGLESNIPTIYAFHHKNPDEKDFALSKKGHTHSWEKCIIEVDKCMLVCQNCHAIIHHEIQEEKIRIELELENNINNISI